MDTPWQADSSVGKAEVSPEELLAMPLAERAERLAVLLYARFTHAGKLTVRFKAAMEGLFPGIKANQVERLRTSLQSAHYMGATSQGSPVRKPGSPVTNLAKPHQRPGKAGKPKTTAPSAKVPAAKAAPAPEPAPTLPPSTPAPEPRATTPTSQLQGAAARLAASASAHQAAAEVDEAVAEILGRLRTQTQIQAAIRKLREVDRELGEAKS